MSDLLERMTPASCRIDLQTDSFEELVKQQGLASLPGAISDVEPWCASALVTSFMFCLRVHYGLGMLCMVMGSVFQSEAGSVLIEVLGCPVQV